MFTIVVAATVSSALGQASRPSAVAARPANPRASAKKPAATRPAGAPSGELVPKEHLNLDGKGDPRFKLAHVNAVCSFAGAANRDAFKEHPARYTVACGGWCAVAMVQGRKVEVDPESFKIKDGRLLLFYRDFSPAR
jgi:hypothetical protein